MKSLILNQTLKSELQVKLFTSCITQKLYLPEGVQFPFDFSQLQFKLISLVFKAQSTSVARIYSTSTKRLKN